ncbi:hypothetical protein MKQ68_04410 [Chitinophaga horti]|uniref:Uncharacterized protein n=1 Tax=Chitinophaga horti TaxID=2920382 RepID=A0ABY6J7S4_9BACT|nr:hypothetical protein [Chitinophaga horti]UYQ94331.1 hypothetical protein MKQ68_04410 [Chitinophaga horti]
MAHQQEEEKKKKPVQAENPIPAGYKKLPDNPEATEDAVSTRGDSANGKYSRTDKRDEDIDNNEVRGGS